MIMEKAFAAAVEPLADSIVQIEKRLKLVEAEQAASGSVEISIDEVSDALIKRADFVELVKGAPGADGRDGAQGDVGLPGSAGRDGIDGAGFNVKAWTPGIYRADAIVQHDHGCISIALKDTNEAPGGPDWQRVGTGGFRWCGVKQESRAYIDGDLYIDNGTTFLWGNGKGNMFCKRGKDGADGVDGRDGIDAPQIIDAHVLDDYKTLGFVLDDGRIVECALPEALVEAVKAVDVIAQLREQVADLKTCVEDLQQAVVLMAAKKKQAGVAHGN